MASHSTSSSLADVGYYHLSPSEHSHSRDSLSSSSSSLSPAAPRLLDVTASNANTQRHRTSLAHIQVPSFLAFRSQASSIPSPSAGPWKRTSGSYHAHSPRNASFSIVEKASPRLAEPALRPFSTASPSPHERGGPTNARSTPLRKEHRPGQEESLPYNFSPPAFSSRHGSIDSRVARDDHRSSVSSDTRRSSIPIHARYAVELNRVHVPKPSISSIGSSIYTSSQRPSQNSMNGVLEAPSMILQFDGLQRTLSDESLIAADSPSELKRPKSPSRGLGNLFGWKSSSLKSAIDSPTTTFSDRSTSPLPSPRLDKPLPTMERLIPPGLDIQRANLSVQYFDHPETPILTGSPDNMAHVKELERELAQVSAELAGSIRREMELEDEIDRMRAELPHIPASELGRRSSDYFSDSGASSTKYPVTDMDAKIESLERSLRKSEQEKANLKNETAQRLQAELGRRRDLEQIVLTYEEQLQKKQDEQLRRGSVEGRVAELETTLEDTRRLLSQERQAKGSFEDLYSASREQLERHKNESDNLRDEVVPQLRARIEGLEADSADTQSLVYENSRIQQELATLREFRDKSGGRVGTIAEEDGPLSRTGSLARRRGGSLSRNGSVKDGGRQRSGSNGMALTADGVKEIEDQRDALHKALQLLITRYDMQQREHMRLIKKLTIAKDRAESVTPRRMAYHKEVSFLKEEVTTLRKRTEDALEQKWQYEKGLSGIKMDLDRAEQETKSLRNLLQEHDDHVTGQSEANSHGHSGEGLKISITSAESERDQARQKAQEYRQRASVVQGRNSVGLTTAANRMDELADQLEKQASVNVQLRERLAQAVAKGEREQRDSSGKIEEMQKRLAGIEDSVLAAQQHSETTLGTHEAEVRRIEEASSPALHRLTITIPDPQRRLTPASSPLLAKSPRLGVGKKLSESSLLEASRTQMLERKVRELEGLLREAEQDMQDVVQTVNRSQIEVAELQTEKDTALAQMRTLQRQINEERNKAEAFWAN